jgi:hypothetical protein
MKTIRRWIANLIAMVRRTRKPTPIHPDAKVLKIDADEVHGEVKEWHKMK